MRWLFRKAVDKKTAFRVRTIFKSSSRKIKASSEKRLLAKALNMFDVTFLSVGNTLGMGIFIFVGRFTKTIGPALLITNILTAGVILISALSYADFIRSENSSGGAYRCIYQQTGEIQAAVLGSLLSTEHLSATALAARGLSMMIDVVTDNQISNSLKKYMTFTNPLLGEYPDVIGFLIPMVSLVILSFDVKTVTNINNVCCLINLGMFTLITLVIGSNLNFDNWFLPPSKDCGKGGFLPYGLEIVFQSIAAVYNSYIGFDAAGHAGAEVRDPERVIPLSMIVSVIMVSIIYILQAFTFTLVWPYCDQDINDPIPDIMENIGMDIMKWITTVGLPLGMLGNFICHTYPLSRLIYAMAEDGLLYSFLAKVNIKTQTPIYALYISGIFTALCALFMDIIQLSQLTSIGAMSAYTLISYYVLVINYSGEEMVYGNTRRPVYKILLNRTPKDQIPTIISSTIVYICCWIIFFTSYPFVLTLRLGYSNFLKGNLLEIIVFASIFLFYLTIVLIINCQPTDRVSKMQIVPGFPVLIILINTYLSMEYSIYSWIHAIIWMSCGMLIYLTYGVWNSKAAVQHSQIHIEEE